MAAYGFNLTPQMLVQLALQSGAQGFKAPAPMQMPWLALQAPAMPQQQAPGFSVGDGAAMLNNALSSYARPPVDPLTGLPVDPLTAYGGKAAQAATASMRPIVIDPATGWPINGGSRAP
jgi:hypothetical protein